MTAPTEKTLNVGLRYACVYKLNNDGLPAADSTTAYEGVQFRGSISFEINVPDARKITGMGEDGITQVVYLPPQEGVDGTLTVEASDPEIIALLDGVKIRTVGETSVIGVATDRQGFEPSVGMLLYQMAVGLDTGKQYWHSYVLPSARIKQKPNAMSGDKNATTYQIAPNRVTKHIWGESFGMTADGFLSGQMIRMWSNYPIRFTAFLGDGATTAFSFPVNYPSITTDGIKVWKNGTEVTSGITKSLTGITFTVAPASNDLIVVLREYAG